MLDFAESRTGRHAGEFLGRSHGSLICDDFAGYKALFLQGISNGSGYRIAAQLPRRSITAWRAGNH